MLNYRAVLDVKTLELFLMLKLSSFEMMFCVLGLSTVGGLWHPRVGDTGSNFILASAQNIECC